MKLTLIAISLLLSGRLYAQKLYQKAEYIELGVFMHSFGVPFLGDQFLRLDHMPGLSIGTSLPINDNKNWRSDYRVRLSGYLSEGLHNGILLENQITQTYKAATNFRIEGNVGLGYLRVFEDAGLYEFSGGTYKPKRDWGRSQLTFSIGFGFSFRLNKASPYWFYTEQQVLLQFPFASKSGVPMLIHNRTHLGVRREINRKFRLQ